MPTANTLYALLAVESLWNAATRCHQALSEAGIAHAVTGSVAVCLHGYSRDTSSVEFLIRSADAERARQLLDPFGVPVRFVIAGDCAGTGSEILLPDPGDATITTIIYDLPILTLAKLIESKIARGMGSPRHLHTDYADIVELIDRKQLTDSFARNLHKSLRATYRELVRMSRGGS